jgi:hypothetical protein
VHPKPEVPLHVRPDKARISPSAAWPKAVLVSEVGLLTIAAAASMLTPKQSPRTLCPHNQREDDKGPQSKRLGAFVYAGGM